MTRLSRAIATLSFGVLFLCGTARAQQPAAPGGTDATPVQGQGQQGPEQQNPGLARRPVAEPPMIGMNAESKGRMQLDVLVTDGDGHPIDGLGQQDFALLDNGQLRPVVAFSARPGAHAASPATSAILLLDTVNMDFETAVRSRQGIEKFLQQNGGQLALPTTLYVFSNDGVRGAQRPTTSGKELEADLAKMDSHFRTIPQSAAGWGEVERVKQSLQALTVIAATEAKEPGRKLLIWIGPGWPQEYKVNMLVSPKEQRAIFATIMQLSNMLREARISVYNASLGAPDLQSTFYQQFLKGVRTPKQAQLNDVSVKVLAVQTGGRIVGPDNDLAPQLANCYGDGGAYYTLSFDPPRADGPDEYHDLKVVMGKSWLKARTTTGYYDEP
jgi:VWFA-related protein